MKKRILCFGDSNTWGYRGEDSERYSEDIRWTGRLQKMLGDEYTVIEEGHNGRTTVWTDPIENRMAGLDYLWPCMESQSPFDLIIIMLGTNDTKEYFPLDAQNIADGAGRLVGIALQSPFGPDHRPPKVLLTAPIRVVNRGEDASVFGPRSEAVSLGFPQAFLNVAQQMGCEYLNAGEFAMPCETDGVHLDETGHEKLAKAMYRKIKEILG